MVHGLPRLGLVALLAFPSLAHADDATSAGPGAGPAASRAAQTREAIVRGELGKARRALANLLAEGLDDADRAAYGDLAIVVERWLEIRGRPTALPPSDTSKTIASLDDDRALGVV